jgi:hypothetical protein
MEFTIGFRSRQNSLPGAFAMTTVLSWVSDGTAMCRRRRGKSTGPAGVFPLPDIPFA